MCVNVIHFRKEKHTGGNAMKEEKKQKLTAAGIDVDNALERFMGNEALLEKFLTKFAKDSNYQALIDAVAAGDKDVALTSSHTLKGVCGNLSMKKLYQLFADQVQLFRADDWEGAVALMPQISVEFNKTVSAISAEE